MVWTSLSQNMTSYCAMTILPIAPEAFYPQRRELSELFKGLKNDCACKRNAKKCLFYGPKKADKCLVVLIMMGFQPKYGHHPKFTREKKFAPLDAVS